MSKVDWSKAPEGAEFYAATRFRRNINKGENPYFWTEETQRWSEGSALEELLDCTDFQWMIPAPLVVQQWPTEDRIQNIGQNGGDGLHYDEQREITEKQAALAEHLKQEKISSRAPDSLGKYDRRIKGKYNTGTCTVDVYRVLSAFEITEPELQHCIKKLLAAGQRGAKDYQQDLREASVSLCMLISRLEEEEINLK